MAIFYEVHLKGNWEETSAEAIQKEIPSTRTAGGSTGSRAVYSIKLKKFLCYVVLSGSSKCVGGSIRSHNRQQSDSLLSTTAGRETELLGSRAMNGHYTAIGNAKGSIMNDIMILTCTLKSFCDVVARQVEGSYIEALASDR